MTSVAVRGIPISVTNVVGAAAQVASWVGSGVSTYVCCASVHLVEEANARPDVRKALRGAGMVVPDGAPVAAAARLLGARAAERVTGSDLFDAVLRLPNPGLRHFFYGSSPEVLGTMRGRVGQLYPGAIVVGVHSPPYRPLTEDERHHAFGLINQARPDVVWVGLGAPKQELWMAEARPHLTAPVLIGVGAVFDFVGGRLKRAPVVLRRYGLEWLYRLAHDPRRLWSRYLVTNTTFLLGVAPAVLQSGMDSRFGRVPNE